MNPLLIIGGLAAVGLYLWSTQSSSAASGAASASAPPAGFQGSPGQFSASTSPGAPAGTNPGNYPVVPVASTTPAGTPAGSSVSGPLVHTGWDDATTGAPILADQYGNPYLGTVSGWNYGGSYGHWG